METGLTKSTGQGLLLLLNTDEQLPPNLQALIKSNRTLQLVFKGECALSHYKTDEQKAFVSDVIGVHLATMTSLLNIGKNIKVEQIPALCELIITEKEFQIISPSEFREAFMRGVKGNYGQNYDSVDIQRIFGWIRGYIDERFLAIEHFREIERSQMKQDSKKPFAALAGLKLPEPPVKTEQPKFKREKTAGEIELDKYIVEFGRLFTEQKGDDTLPTRFVEYKEQALDLDGYCNKRWDESRENV